MHRVPKIIKVKLSSATNLTAHLHDILPPEIAPLANVTPIQHTTAAGVPKVIDWTGAVDAGGILTITAAVGVGATAFETNDIITLLVMPGAPDVLPSVAA